METKAPLAPPAHTLPLGAAPKHIVAYLKLEGVTRDGEEARMFDAASGTADERTLAGHCADDRHHFRLVVSLEDAGRSPES